MADHRLEIVLSGKDASQKAFRSVQQRIKGFTKSVFNMRNAMAGAAGAAGLGYMINRSLEVTRELEKLEKQTGFSTTAIQELQFAAREAGVRNERLYDALGEISQRMGEASADFRRTGGDVTEMGEGFEAAGIAMEGIDERNPQQVLYEVADAIRDAETESQALNIAVKTFGDEGGRDMVAMLREGSDGLRDMAERANELGLVLDRDVIKQSADAKERIDLLVDVLGTQFQRVVGELAPEISKTADDMADWVAENEDFITQDLPETLGEIASGVGAVTTKIGGMVKAIDEKYDRVQGFFDNIRDRIPLTEIPPDLEEGEAMHKRSVDISDLNEKTQKAEDSTRNLATAIQILNREMNAGDDTRGLTAARQILNREMTAQEDSQPSTITPKVSRPDEQPSGIINPEELQRASDIYEQTRTPVENLKTEVLELNQLASRGLIDHETYVRALDEAYGNLGDKAKETGDETASQWDETYNQMANAFDGWANQYSSKLNDMLWESELTFDGILESFGKMITEMMIQSAMADITGELFGKSGGGEGDGLVKTGAMAALEGIGGAMGFDNGGVLPEDIYGVGKSGRSYKMHAGETVQPTHKDRSAGEKKQYNSFHITVQAPDGNLSKQSTRQLKRELSRSVDSANRRQ